MPLKNYTSETPASRSIQHIEEALVRAGASKISKEYGPRGELARIVFSIEVRGQDVPFRIEARIAECRTVLEGMRTIRGLNQPGVRDRIREQAVRTAWKILSDWIDAQLAMVELAQVELVEVMLPYIWLPSKQQTLYQSIAAGGFKQLGAGAP